VAQQRKAAKGVSAIPRAIEKRLTLPLQVNLDRLNNVTTAWRNILKAANIEVFSSKAQY